MKEFIPLLWIFVVVGAWVFSAVKKNMKEPANTPKHMPEAWPTAPEVPAQDELPAQEPKVLRKKQVAADSQPTQSLSYELNEYKKHMQIRSKPRTTIKAVAEEPESPISGEGSVSDENNIAAEFDLRKAVIYSEILKPKFEE